MRVELGAQVRTSDGKDVGKIEKLIVHPESGEVQAVVVRQGFILTNDVAIPFEALESSTEDGLRLSYTEDQVKDLPGFVEENYTTPATGYQSPFGYPTPGLLWPTDPVAGYGTPGLGYGAGRASPEQSAPPRQDHTATTAAIDEGTDVISRDGEKVGEVHSVAVDADTGQPTGFIVRKGFLFTEDLELPATAIEAVDERGVYLNLDKDEVTGRAGRGADDYPRTMM